MQRAFAAEVYGISGDTIRDRAMGGRRLRVWGCRASVRTFAAIQSPNERTASVRTFAAIQSPNERTANAGVGEEKAAIQSPNALTATTGVTYAAI